MLKQRKIQRARNGYIWAGPEPGPGLQTGLPGSTPYATASEFASFDVMALPVQNASGH